MTDVKIGWVRVMYVDGSCSFRDSGEEFLQKGGRAPKTALLDYVPYSTIDINQPGMDTGIILVVHENPAVRPLRMMYRFDNYAPCFKSQGEVLGPDSFNYVSAYLVSAQDIRQSAYIRAGATAWSVKPGTLSKWVTIPNAKAYKIITDSECWDWVDYVNQAVNYSWAAKHKMDVPVWPDLSKPHNFAYVENVQRGVRDPSVTYKQVTHGEVLRTYMSGEWAPYLEAYHEWAKIDNARKQQESVAATEAKVREAAERKAKEMANDAESGRRPFFSEGHFSRPPTPVQIVGSAEAIGLLSPQWLKELARVMPFDIKVTTR